MYTLFVARDKRVPSRHNIGSVLCMDIVRQLEESTIAVQVQEVTGKEGNLPKWLTGTPTLLDSETGERNTGTRALGRLQGLLVRLAEERGEQRARSGGGGKTRSDRMSRPAVQLRSETKGRAATTGKEEEQDMGADSIVPTTTTEESLWESCIDEKDIEEEEVSDGKLRSDDLQRELQKRQQTMSVPSSAPPPPPLPPLN